MKRIWHISDTHTMEKYLAVPDNIDIVICSGDMSNPRDLAINEREVRQFIEWFGNLPIKNKVCIAGNHDLSIQAGRVNGGDFAQAGIIYLENNSTEVEGLKFWGSPITPSFGMGWAFNKDRSKLDALWSNIPEDTDIVITHGPAKGVLDFSYSREGVFERCGCTALRRHIYRVKPKLFCFGHIHDCEDITNAGVVKLSSHQTIYSNGSVVKDGRFDMGAIHNGNLFNYTNDKITILDY